MGNTLYSPMGNTLYRPMGNTLYRTSNPIAVNMNQSSITYDGGPSKQWSIRYTVAGGTRTCTLRITAYGNHIPKYTYKAKVELLDLSDGDEARAEVCVVPETDSYGTKIGPEEISHQGNVVMNHYGENIVFLSYGSSLREGLLIIERRKEVLVVAHNYWCVDKAQCLVVQVEIRSDPRLGLLVKFYPPFQNYTNLRAMQTLHSQRIRSKREGLDSSNNSVQVQSAMNTLIKNIGSQITGDYNGSSIQVTHNHYYGRDGEGDNQHM